jgi:GNAT superfamily N-acetyltransferase
VAALEVLGARSVDRIAALCRWALERPPSVDELRACLWAPDQPAIVRGDPDVGVVAAVPAPAPPAGGAAAPGGSVRLLVVHPAHQGRGLGTELLRAAERDLLGRGERAEVTVGADPPYYLFPGVETTQLAMLCLLERHHYNRVDATFNMDVDLEAVAPPPPGPIVAGPGDRDEVAAFIAAQWPFWEGEVMRALANGTLAIERDESGIAAFCAWDVNRRGTVGPVAVRAELIGRGRGVAVLLLALARLRAAGWRRVEVQWVGPVVPYARVGGAVGRVFFVYRKTLTA